MNKQLLFIALVLASVAAIAQDTKQTFTRKILIEQFTTAQCGYCPAGADRIHSVVDGNNNIIWIKHHAGFGTDNLTNNIHEALTIFYGGSTFAPAMMLDRTRFNTSDAGPVGNVGNASAIRALVAQAKEVPTYCKIYTPTVAYNPDTRQVSGTISGRFGDEVWTDRTRIVIFVVEDSIFMQQHDYYNGVSSNSYNVDYWHMGTVRDAITNMWGDTFSVEGSNMEFSIPFTYTLPDNYVAKNCKIVAFIYNYDANNVNNCKVMNAAESDFLSNLLGIGETSANSQLRLYPNPATDRVVLESDAPIQRVVVVNAMGQTVMQTNADGSQHFALNLQGLAAGQYVVLTHTAQGIASRRLVVK